MMMADEKRYLILDEGVPVEVSDHTGVTLFTTQVLIGKASKQSQSEISHESHRKAHFLPELEIANGLIVKNLVTLEKYLTIATMVEAYGNEAITKISRMVLTNASVSVSGLVETADENGDVFKGEMVKVTDLPVYIVTLNAELTQYQPGQQVNAEYVIHCPPLEFELLDKVTVHQSGRNINVKIQYIDYLTFPGMTLIYVKTETRA